MDLKLVILQIFGFIFLGFGAVGIFVPLLPTTPFVILASACFGSSPKIQSKIMKIKFFKNHIENYKHRRGLDKKTVVSSLLFLWGMMAISIFSMRNSHATIMLILIAIAVTIHILCVAKKRK